MVDLHMHSLYSDDGEFSPEELVQKCAAAGVTLLSVADHNCVRANAEARACAGRRGLDYIDGIEIDCRHAGVNFHVLGYGINPQSADFAAIEQNISRQSREASQTMLAATRKMGFAVAEADLYALSQSRYWKDRWTGEMFAEVLLARPDYARHPLLAPYRPGGARADNPYVNFYWDYYSQGKPGYYEMAYPSVTETVEIIHANGGLAVLAHPGVNLKGHEELLPRLAALGLDGIEAYSSYHTPAQRDYYCKQAAALGLFCTAGSDFHGATKPDVLLGKTGGSPDEKALREIFILPHSPQTR